MSRINYKDFPPRGQRRDYGSFVIGLEYDTRSKADFIGSKDLIKRVIFNPPCTIVIWFDESKTIVKAENESFDPEKGLAMAISKKFFGNKGNYYEVFKKWILKEKTNE